MELNDYVGELNEYDNDKCEKILSNHSEFSWHPAYNKSIKEKIEYVIDEIFDAGMLPRSPQSLKITLWNSIGKRVEKFCIDKGLISKNKNIYNKINSFEELQKFVKRKKLSLTKSKNKEDLYYIHGAHSAVLEEIKHSVSGLWVHYTRKDNPRYITFIKYSDNE